MSATVPMTVQDLMDEIYVAVDNDPTSSTDTTQDEWTSRLRLMNMAIKAWEREDVLWNELWKTYTHGSSVTSATTYTISATDFRFPGSYLKFTLNGSDTYLEIVEPEEGFKYALTGSRAAYITGNPQSGWTINLTFTPASGDAYFGATMSFNYYKSANRMASASDTPEMSDPSFIVAYVSYKKNLYNGRANVAADQLSDMQTALSNMKYRNAMRVQYGSNEIEDLDSIRNNGSLGY